MNKNRFDRIVVISTQWVGMVFVLGLIVWSVFYAIDIFRYEQTNDAQVDAYLSPVNVKVGGYIKKIYFQDNQRVHRGDTLVLIATDEFQLKADAAAAELLSVRAKLGVLQANEETQKRNIEVIHAHLSGVQAKLHHQELDYERYQNLLKEEATTRQKFEHVQAALLVNQSDYQEATAALKVAVSKLDDLYAEKAAIAADIKIKEALFQRQQLDIAYTVISAPFDGEVGRKTIQEGQLVQAGQTLVFLTNEKEAKWIVANFKETQIAKFQVGQQAKIVLDAFPGEHFSGVIESFSPTTGSRYSLLPPDNATGNFVKVIQRIPVRIKLTESGDRLSKLSAGMNANVSIEKN
ncbi:HlyD family secretion protein [Chitinophaga pendula]|uniref:HlyD family secretion protein n=1 Tax=Chitinophaga TaxID=79328 RepID=UPI000BB06804|nr:MULTISPECIES: HlyD family secretion protein [Chitinophaga]ASZ12121.1 multidrug transporter [Chitinophaga sp. MD30]UCJ04840.1 HlyD family secretion protein [Chitinophaga pendula]